MIWREKIMIIGICGKSGSGKSTLGRQLLELIPNAVYLDIKFY